MTAANDIQIWPNPSSGVFKIRTKGIANGVIEVVNLEGKSIYKTAIEKNTSDYKIDLSAYPHGTYIVTISSDNKEITSKKLIVE